MEPATRSRALLSSRSRFPRVRLPSGFPSDRKAEVSEPVESRRLSQYGAWRSVNIGKCRTLRVSKREPVRMAVAAMARSAPSMV